MQFAANLQQFAATLKGRHSQSHIKIRKAAQRRRFFPKMPARFLQPARNFFGVCCKNFWKSLVQNSSTLASSYRQIFVNFGGCNLLQKLELFKSAAKKVEPQAQKKSRRSKKIYARSNHPALTTAPSFKGCCNLFKNVKPACSNPCPHGHLQPCQLHSDTGARIAPITVLK